MIACPKGNPCPEGFSSPKWCTVCTEAEQKKKAATPRRTTIGHKGVAAETVSQPPFALGWGVTYIMLSRFDSICRGCNIHLDKGSNIYKINTPGYADRWVCSMCAHLHQQQIQLHVLRENGVGIIREDQLVYVMPTDGVHYNELLKEKK